MAQLPRFFSMNACPSMETLEQLLAGARADTLVEHIERCPACQVVLDRLSEASDLRAWRGEPEATGPVPNGEPGLASILQHWRDPSVVDRLCVDGSRQEVSSLAFLGPPRQEGELGVLGTYRVQGELGRGGMGIVLRAYDEALRRTVALKVLRPELAEGSARQRFVREAQAVAQIRHDHVVTIFAVANPPDGLPFFAMEHLPGPTLADLLEEDKALEPRQAVTWIAQAADGLAAAHATGMLHRDVKPANLIRDPATDRVKVLDFGLARLGERPSEMTHHGAVVGTPAYMSPEQARGSEPLDARTDVYSLGVTLYKALTGVAPFRGQPHLILQQVANEDPRPLRQLNDRIPRDLETICLKAMAREPGHRYATAQALADDLRRWLRGEPILARPVGRIERLLRWCRRHPAVACLSLALLLVFLAGLSGVIWQWQRAEAKAAESQRAFLRARSAVDKYLTEVSEDPDLKAHNLEPLRRRLLKAAQDYYEDFVREHPETPGLRAELGRAYGRLGAIAAILDSPPQSIPLYEKKRAVFAQLHEDNPEVADYANALAESYWRLGYAYHYKGQMSEAWEAFGKAKTLWEGLTRKHPDEPEYSARLVRNLNSLARSYNISRRTREAEQTFQEGQAAYARWAARHPPTAKHQESYALLLANLGSFYRTLRRLERAQSPLEESCELAGQLVRKHPTETSYRGVLNHALIELGWVHFEQQAAGPAEAVWHRAAKVAEELARDHPGNGEYQEAMATVYESLGQLWTDLRAQPTRAAQWHRQALAVREKLVADCPSVWPYHTTLAGSYAELAQALRVQGRAQEILDLTRTALERAKTSVPPGATFAPFGRLTLHAERAITLLQLGRHADALQELDRALHLKTNPWWGEELKLLRTVVEGHKLLAQGKVSQAARLAQSVGEAAGKNGRPLWLAAGLLARCAAAVPKDDGRAEKYVTQALQLLERVRAAGQLRFPGQRLRLDTDPAFVFLRGRAGFRRLLADRGQQ